MGMGKGVVLGGFAVAVLAACVWLLWSTPDAPREVTGVTPGPDGSAAGARSVPSTAGSALAEPAPSGSAARVERTGADAERRFETGPAPVEEHDLELRVIGADGEPVSGAEVFLLENAGERELERFNDPDRIDALMESEGRSEITDESGTLRVPAPGDRPTLVLGRLAPLWGRSELHAGRDREQPAELTLAPDVTLRARVVDGAGAPVPDVPVQLVQQHVWGPRPAWSALTRGAEGIAVLRHVQDRLGDGSGDPWALRLDVALREPLEHALDPSDLPSEPATLVVPAFGSVEVNVYGDDRRPFTGEARASLSIADEDEPDEPSPLDPRGHAAVERPVVDGLARFPCVEPGLEVRIAVTRQGSDVPTRTRGPGPARAGLTRSFGVRLGSDHPVALLRAVDQKGRPIADAELDVVLAVHVRFSNQGPPARVRTGADGTFQIDIGTPWTEGVRRELLVSQGAADAVLSSGRVDLSHPLRNGVNDLGVVRLEPAPLFVAGRVLSASGEPLPGAILSLETRAAGTTRWVRDWRFRHRSDENGAFLVRGIRAGDEFRLGASHEGSAGPKMPFSPGADGLVIGMLPEGALEGRVLLDAGFPEEALELQITGDIDNLDYSARRSSLDADGTFRFSTLLKGKYGVIVHAVNQSKPIATIEGIAVRGGETARDPRLDPLDLRGRIHAHRVSIVLPGGDGRVHGTVRFGPAGGARLEERRWFQRTAFWLVTEDERIDLSISAGGYRATRLNDVAGEIEVALARSHEVHMVLDPGVPLPRPPVYLKAVLRPSGGGDVDWGAPAFDERREISVDVPGPGEMRVVWIVERRTGGKAAARSFALEPIQLVRIEDVPDQRVEVTLTGEQLERLLAPF